MRRVSFFIALMLAAGAMRAADKLSIIDAYFEDPEHRIVRSLMLNAGETCYFTFKVSGFRTDAKHNMQLEYRVQFLDPKGVPVVEDFSDKMEATLSAQDANWLPKLAWERIVPPFAPAGDYQLKVHVEDKIGKTTADFETTFKVRGESINPGDKLVVQQFIFSDTENGRQKNDDVYHQGTVLWARFKLTGYKIEDKSYFVEADLAILDSSGQPLYTNPNAAVEKNRMFYPPHVLSTNFNLDVSKSVRPGEYTLRLDIRDKIGNQTASYESKFHVEP
jgi:hypothetical protein